MKSIFHSRTFWLAFFQGLAGLLAVFITEYPTVGYLAMFKSIVDIGLRYSTDTGIK